jgi:hypothetical protein
MTKPSEASTFAPVRQSGAVGFDDVRQKPRGDACGKGNGDQKGTRHEDSRVAASAKFTVLAVQCFLCVVKVRRVTAAVMVAAQAQDLCSEAF